MVDVPDSDQRTPRRSSREPQRTQRDTVAMGCALLVAVGLGVGVLVVILKSVGVIDEATATKFVSGLVSLVITGVLIALIWLGRNAEDRRVSEGRARVREAEQGLERALRPDSQVAAGGTLIVHGDLVLPQADERSSGQQTEPSSSGQPDPDDAINGAARSLRGSARLTLSELWAVTHRRLDLYHEIALGQASRLFRNAQLAMVLGFVLLVGFVLVALRASTTAGSVVAGGLGAVAAGLAGYVSRTFVRSQEASAEHLRAYFDQPLEFSRYLAAERLVADAGLSDERRAEVLTALVEAMVAGGSQGNSDPSDAADGSTAP
jgi:hypothetical protein